MPLRADSWLFVIDRPGSRSLDAWLVSGKTSERRTGPAESASGGARTRASRPVSLQQTPGRIACPSTRRCPPRGGFALIAHDSKKRTCWSRPSTTCPCWPVTSCSRQPRPAASCSSSACRSPASGAALMAVTSKSAPASPRATLTCWSSSGTRWSRTRTTPTSTPCAGRGRLLHPGGLQPGNRRLHDLLAPDGPGPSATGTLRLVAIRRSWPSPEQADASQLASSARRIRWVRPPDTPGALGIWSGQESPA